MRVIDGFLPEKVFVDLGNQIIALKTLAVVEIGVLKSSGFFTLGFEARDLFFKAFLAPIGEFAIVFMFAGIDRKLRICVEIVF